MPIIAVAMRRLHDTGRSGWWVWIGVVPLIGWIVQLVFYCQDSQSENKYGPSPKYSSGWPQPQPYGGYPSPSGG